MKKIYALIVFAFTFAIGHAQQPNRANRLPISADMPEWAKKLYFNDAALNVFELDRAFAPWQLKFDSLKAEVAKAGDGASEALKETFGYYKKYQKYYVRWRARVYPYLLSDGSLDFSIKTDKDFVQPQNQEEKSSGSTWSYLGPVITRFRLNDNAAQPLAPWQANVYCLDVAPSNPDVLYYGTETGIVGKTTDKGLNWSPVGDQYFTNNIGAIAIHPTNPDTVYVSEYPNKISRTTDGGVTWTEVRNIANFQCEDIKIKPNEPDVVLAAGTSLQRRSTGNVWTNVLNKRAYDVAFKPGDPSIAYVLVENTALDLCEFWKSTDGGQTWSIRSTGWITGLTDGGGRLTVTPADNNRIYAVLLTGSGPRVMRSDDAGETWTIIAASNETGLIGPCTTGPLSMTNGQGFFDLSIAASHTNADHIILGTTTSFKSTDGGVNYTLLGGYCGAFNTHPDIQEMVARGSDTWIVTDGGINLSTDFYTLPTANYSVRINNMRGSEHWGFDAGWNEDVLVGGRYHNGNMAWRESYPAGDYLRMGGGEAPTGYVNPGNPSLTYFSDLGGRILPATNNLAVGSFSVTKWPNEGFFPMEGAEQKWDPRYMYTYYLGNGNQFWKTTDNGLTFSALFTHSSATAKIRYIEVSRANPDVIYFTVQISGPNDGELWKTTDGGVTWTQCANPGTLTASQRRISKITMSGSDPNTIWWGFRSGPNGQKIFKSIDGGATWTNWTTATLNNVDATDILHQLGTNGGVYFVSGSGGKVFYRDNAASDWVLYNTGLPLGLYGDFGGVFAKPFYKGGKLRIGTGNGIWEADLYTPSTTTLVQPMVDNATPSCGRDTIQLESYSVVNGGASYHWEISPAPMWISNPDIRNPRIVLGTTPGFYAATLTVTDANGTTTRTVTDLINNLPLGNLCAADTIPGQALILDGVGDFAAPSNNLNLNSNTVSMTAWVKRNGAQVDFSGIVYARGGTTSAGLSITSSNQLRYTWDDAGGTYGFNTNFTIPDNTWTHVALVITPSSARVYMNGVAATRTATHAAEAFDTPVKIGYDQGSRYFKGEIDEVTVWNKSLTQNEVRELMHLTLAPQNQPNLVSYYQFNEPSGAANDKVASRHAALAGDATRSTSTGPFGGGSVARQSVTSGGAITFTGTDVILGFPMTGTYPNGEIVVSRINLAPNALPSCSAYASSNHYWIIENFGSNQTFSALDSARFGNFLVPATDAIPATSYKLNRRTISPAIAGTGNGAANSDMATWTLQPGSSIGAAGGPNGRITFGTTSAITQFGQFIATNALPGQIITGPAAVCSGSSATLDAGAGYATYAWSNGGGSGQTATFSNLTNATTFMVSVTDVNGCEGLATKTININALPAPVITGPTAVCSGSNATLDAGAGYATYAWSNGGGSGQTATFTNITSPTTYSVTVTDANGCSGSDSHAISINPNLAPVITGPTAVCSGSNATLDAGAGYSTYAWSNGGGSGQTATFTNITSPTTYSVTVTDANGCSGSDSHAIGINPNLAPVITGPTAVCSGSNATLDAGAGYSTYAWSNGGGSGQTATFTNITSPTTYSVTVTDANGCSGSDSHAIGINPNLSPVITGPTAVCSGSNATLDAGAGYATYAWSNGGGSGQTAIFTNITSPTTYSVTVTDANGCSGSDSHAIGINSNLSPVITGPTAVCSGSNATLDAGAGYATYAWSNGGGSGQTAIFTNITSPTTYSVTVTDANGCSGSDSHAIGINPNLSPVITGPTAVCSGSNATLDAGAGYATYAWSNGGGSGQTATFTNITSPTTYSVTVTDANGCSGSDSHAIGINPNLSPVITGPTAVCSGANATLDAGAGYATYAWSNGGGSGQTATFTNITSPTTYSVTVTDANGCSGSDSHAIGINPSPAPVITGPTAVCSGANATLDAGAGYATYAWSNGGGSSQTATFSNIIATTTYFVTVTNANGCSGITSFTVSTHSDDLPSGWSNNDAGAANGDASFSPCTGSGGTFTVSATGFSTSSSDVLHAAYQQICGNSEIITRVLTVSSGGWGGVMIRETLAPGSKKASMKTQLSSIIRREIRATTNGAAAILNFARPQHVWLRLVRIGSSFTGYSSTNGVNWDFAFSATISMTGCVYVGIFSESINNATTTTATFDNVTVTGSPLSIAGGSNPLPIAGSDDQVQVYPNPTTGEVNITLGDYAGKPGVIEVFNALGERVIQKQLVPHNFGPYSLHIANITGVYTISIQFDERRIVRRVVVDPGSRE